MLILIVLKQYILKDFPASPAICTAAAFDLFGEKQTLTLGVPPQFGIYRRSVQEDGGGGGGPPPDPPPDYTGRGFQLRIIKENGTDRLICVPSTINGQLPAGMSLTAPYYLSLTQGIVWARVQVNQEGAITSRTIDKGTAQPVNNPTGGSYHLTIGLVTYNAPAQKYEVRNDHFGPLDFTSCGIEGNLSGSRG